MKLQQDIEETNTGENKRDDELTSPLEEPTHVSNVT